MRGIACLLRSTPSRFKQILGAFIMSSISEMNAEFCNQELDLTFKYFVVENLLVTI